MHSSVRKTVALWFLFVAIAVVGAGYAGFGRLSGYILAAARTQMEWKLDHVIDVLEATNSTYLHLVRSSMVMLKMLCQERSPAHLKRIIKPEAPPRKC